MQESTQVLSIITIGSLFIGIGPAFSQTLPALPTAVAGQTSTVNVSSGTRATLSIGTSNAFGTTATISAMPGATVKSESKLAPLTGKIKTSLGSTGTTEGPSTIKADISNVRTSGGGTTNFDNGQGDNGTVTTVNGQGDNDTVTSAKDANFAEGSTTLVGMGSDFEVELDPGKTSFSVSVDSPSNATTTNVSNGSAAANITSNINVDISNTAFASAFSQGF